MRAWEFATDGNTAVEALAQELRRAKRASGLTQLEIESRTEVSDSTLSRYFNGTIQSPKPSVIAKLSVVLDVPYEKLMALADYPLSADPATADEAQTLELIRAFPWALGTLRDLAALHPSGRAAVFALIRTLRTHEETEPQ